MVWMVWALGTAGVGRHTFAGTRWSVFVCSWQARGQRWLSRSRLGQGCSAEGRKLL